MNFKVIIILLISAFGFLFCSCSQNKVSHQMLNGINSEMKFDEAIKLIPQYNRDKFIYEIKNENGNNYNLVSLKVPTIIRSYKDVAIASLNPFFLFIHQDFNSVYILIFKNNNYVFGGYLYQLHLRGSKESQDIFEKFIEKYRNEKE